MKLFKYESWKVTISEEAYALKAFRKIWKRDKTKDKEKAIMELGYVYFMCDPRSDYQIMLDEEDRSAQIIIDQGFRKGWEPDADVKDAMKLYESFTPISSLLLQDTRIAVNKLRDYFTSIDLFAEDDKGKPKYNISAFTSAVNQVPVLINTLSEVEKKVDSDMKESSTMRGQGEKTIAEDGL